MDTSTVTNARAKKIAKRQRYLAEQAERAKLQGIAERPAGPVTSLTRDEIHRVMMHTSLDGKTFEDVKFFAFSRRTRTGAIDTPLPIVANTTLIRKASSHFNYVFGAGFSESNIVNMESPYPDTRPSMSNCYDYMSDSDLDDEDHEEGSAAVKPQADAAPSSGAQADPESHADAPDVKEADVPVGSAGQCHDAIGFSIVRPGRVVFLEDVAYTTWKVFVFYAYFGEVNFAPLRSEHKPRPLQAYDSHKAPLCSAKSMYRVAHKYDVAVLKDLALAGIKSSLSPHNILEELFSSVTALYPAIQEMELQFLYDNIRLDTGVQARLPTWLQTLEEGHLPRGAASIVSNLILKLINTPHIETVTVPAPVQPGMKACPNGCTTYNYRCGCGRNF